jgi:hypothetical protein
MSTVVFPAPVSTADGVGIDIDPVVAARGARARWLRPYWPIDVAFGLYGLSWALGLSGIVLPMLAVPLAARLFQMRPVRIPRGFGWYATYLGWVVLSGVNLPESTRLVFFTWRLGNYASSAVFLLAIYNAPIEKLSTERVVRALSVLWVTTILGGHLALRLPRFSFTSPMQQVMPGALRGNDVIFRYVHPHVADVQTFLGFGVPRPSAPFIYTNMWGSNLTLLFPFVLLLGTLVGLRQVRVAMVALVALALPPFIFSLNRMAWFSAAFIAVLIAFTTHRKLRTQVLVGIAGAVLALFLALAFTPLGTLVEDRLETGHSDNTRADLASQGFEVANKSPLIGYGRPLPNIRFPLRADIGTQGFFWTVLVSQGYIGVALYAAWLLDALRRAFIHRARPEARCALMVILLFMVQSTAYDFLPTQVFLVAIAIALERRAAWIAGHEHVE